MRSRVTFAVESLPVGKRVTSFTIPNTVTLLLTRVSGGIGIRVRSIQRNGNPKVHKGIRFCVQIDGNDIMVSDSLLMHYVAKLNESRVDAKEWSYFLPPITIDGGSTLSIQMKAGEFADAPED